MLVSELLFRVKRILLDEELLRWVEQELLDWYNDAIRQVVMLRPDAASVTNTFTCQPTTRQTLNVADYRLLDITHNTNGRVIHRIARTALDLNIPNWHGATATALEIEYFVYDEKFPNIFFVYPKPASGVPIEVVTSRLPAPATATDVDIALHNIYFNALADYILHRAFMKDSSAGSITKSEYHHKLFLSAIISKGQSDGDVSPGMALNSRGNRA